MSLEIDNVSKYFGGLKALSNVSFRTPKDKIIGLMGPNSAGKTTLFNIITGFIKCDEGRIINEGEDITGLPPYKICMKGLVRTWQLLRKFSSMSTFEDVMVASYFKCKDSKSARDKAIEIMDFVGLSGKEDVPTVNLTPAEGAFLQIARALCLEPKMLLLDEPMIGLNREETQNMKKLIMKIYDQGIIPFIVEHNVKALVDLADWIIVLDHGRIIKEGAPKEVVNDKKVIEACLGRRWVQLARS